MKANREIRREAWALLGTKWFWRLLTVGLTLNVIAQTAGGLLARAFQEMEIQTWSQFMLSKLNAWKAGLDYSVPSLRAARLMTGATLFETFVLYLFGAILAFGFASAMLKAVRNDENRWLADSFGGFRQPWGVTGLMVVLNLRIFLWALLLVVPGLVAVYRYRQAWYLKSEHPDWSAAQCLAESGRMMDGYKKQAFFLDCSYLAWFLLPMALAVLSSVANLAAGGSAFGSLLARVFQGIALFSMLFVLCYFFVGRAIFYRELRASVS